VMATCIRAELGRMLEYDAHHIHEPMEDEERRGDACVSLTTARRGREEV